MRVIAASALFIIAIIAGSLTIAGNAAYGLTVRDSVMAAWGFGLLDAFKVLLPLLLVGSLRRSPASAATGAVVMLGLAVFSVIAIRSVVIAQLVTQQHAAVSQSQSIADVRSELDRVVDDLKKDGWFRPAGQVEAEIAALHRDARWTNTAGCTADVTGDRRKFCADADKLSGDLKAATKREKLLAREAELRAKLGPAAKPVTSDLADLAALIGIKPEHVTSLSALALAVLVELLSLAVPALALAAARDLRQPSAQIQTPAAAPAPAAVVAAPKPLKPVQPLRFNAKPKSVAKPTKVAAASVNVVPLRRQPLALVRNGSAATPLPKEGGNPIASRQGNGVALGGGNPAMATPLPCAAAPPGNPQQMLALATVGNPHGTPLAGGSGNPVSSRQDAEADLVGLLRTGNPMPSQTKLAERWGVNSGTASKWIARLEADGVIAVTLHDDGSKLIQLPS